MPVEMGLYEILGLQGNANHSVSAKTFFLSLNIYHFNRMILILIIFDKK